MVTKNEQVTTIEESKKEIMSQIPSLCEEYGDVVYKQQTPENRVNREIVYSKEVVLTLNNGKPELGILYYPCEKVEGDEIYV